MYRISFLNYLAHIYSFQKANIPLLINIHMYLILFIVWMSSSGVAWSSSVTVYQLALGLVCITEDSK